MDAATLEFELSLRKVLENDCNLPEGLKSYANVHRSFGDVSTETIWSDVNYLIISFILVYIFVQVMLGKFNRVEQRVIFLKLAFHPIFVFGFGLRSYENIT